MMIMFALVGICMLLSSPPSDSIGGVEYIITVIIVDMFLLLLSVLDM